MPLEVRWGACDHTACPQNRTLKLSLKIQGTNYRFRSPAAHGPAIWRGVGDGQRRCCKLPKWHRLLHQRAQQVQKATGIGTGVMDKPRWQSGFARHTFFFFSSACFLDPKLPSHPSKKVRTYENPIKNLHMCKKIFLDSFGVYIGFSQLKISARRPSTREPLKPP